MVKAIVEADPGVDDMSPLKMAINRTRGLLQLTHNSMFPTRMPHELQERFFMSLAAKKEIDSDELRGRLPEAAALKTYTDGKPLTSLHREVVVRQAAFFVACAFYVKAVVFARSSDEAWEHLLEANFYLGWFDGRVTVRSPNNISKAGTDAVHKTNRANKAKVFAWLDANRSKYKSMDSTAEAIAGKVVHVSWRTARDWVSEWKKLRSAGKP